MNNFLFMPLASKSAFEAHSYLSDYFTELKPFKRGCYSFRIKIFEKIYLSISFQKIFEWRDPDTTAIQTSFYRGLKPVCSKILGYRDVCIFHSMEDVKKEIKRLKLIFKTTEEKQCFWKSKSSKNIFYEESEDSEEDF